MKTNGIENLVFEGGGVKGSVYAGCIQVIDEHKLFDQIKRVAGTSAGSITATLLAIGAGSSGLTESILHSNFNKFIYDKGGIIMDIYRVFKKFGIHSGDSFVKILKEYIQRYAGNPNLSFAELEEMIIEEPHKYKQLTVVASNLSRQKLDIFDAANTPDIPIWKAVRASMSIPMVFKPFIINGDYYMDGGLSMIYPIGIYDQLDEHKRLIRNQATLGFYLEPHSQREDGNNFNPSHTEINSLKSTAEAMFDFLSENANAQYIHPNDKERTVFVDDLGVKATDFGISKSMIKELIASGRKATEKYLQHKMVKD